MGNVAKVETDEFLVREAREADPKKNKDKRKQKKKGKNMAAKNKKGKSARKGKGKSAKKGKGKSSRKNKQKKAKKGKKGKKNQKKNKKGEKKNKKKGNRKSKKASKKKSRKSKSKKNKKNKTRKQNKKGKKSKKNNKKSRKNKKKSGKRKVKHSFVRQSSSCMNETCINNAMSYMKLMKDRVANFLAQKSRIAAFNKTSGNKAGKKGLFGPILNRIREAGGGNSSNLKCNGNATNAGAAQLKNLTTLLFACEENINKSCNAELPPINNTKHELCDKAMTAFSALTKECIGKSGEAACKCWTNSTLEFSANAVKKCDIKDDNKKMTAAKKKCTTAFGKCRKTEDDVSTALSACAPVNSAEKVKADIKQGYKNKAAAAKASAKINATAKATSRAADSMACAAFLSLSKTATQAILQAPLLSSLETLLLKIVSATVSTCTADQKASLLTVSGEMDKNAAAIDLNIASKQTDLETQTGTTVSSDDLTDAPTAAPAPTSTKSSSRLQRNLFRAANLRSW